MKPPFKSNAVAAALSLLLIVGCASSTTDPTGGDIKPPGGGTPGDLNQQGAWMWANPTPQGDPLRRVRFASPTTIYAVSHGGAVLKSIDTGRSWEVAFSVYEAQVVPYGGLFDLCFLDDKRGFVVGSVGQVSYTGDGGNTWSDESVVTTQDLRSVFFHDDMNGFVVGDRGSFYSTNDGGSTWTPVSHSSGTEDLNAITFTSANVGWVGGNSNVVLRTDDGGATWAPVANLGTHDYKVVSPMADDQAMFGSEQGAVMASRPGGNWSYPLGGDVILDLQFSDIDNGSVLYLDGGTYWVGVRRSGNWTYTPLSLPNTPLSLAMSGSDAAIVGWHGIMAYSSDGGVTWQGTSQQLNNNNTYTTQLFDVAFADEMLGLAVGTDGTILRSDDGGVTWSVRSSGLTEDLYGVSIHSGGTAFAVGLGKNAARSSDGGMTWQIMNLPVDTQTLHAARHWDNANAIIVGAGSNGVETILVTSDGGSNWTQKGRGVPPQDGKAYFDVWTHGTSKAWLGSQNGLVMITDDAGDSWIDKDTQSNWAIQSIMFVDDTHGWGSTRNNDIVLTTDGGANWTQVPSQHAFWDVQFGSKTVGIGVSTTGNVWGSSDGGLTWTQQHAGWTTWAHVRAAWMTNASDGIIVGTETKIQYTRTAGLRPGLVP